ncbi:hypothetical protein DKT77_07325 [Meridianimarinicoccus roseus]|uniref:DUF2061 domain-containing protein n=1 Tax=Meridianimarinicoccus roseus TaxID=2072018 RepID=A0A2V2LLS0_9RHOB|nr:DUF2061 domain-containing protein [Meridianimarinicoccus roseus]PWR03269.1 hypothetical protein DKT77_07325 [Meridianimarinicoccus roseus]
MESPKRTVVKALTWQALGLVVMTAIGFVVTGSVGAGGSIAVTGALSGLLFYVLHERVWARIGWGRG